MAWCGSPEPGCAGTKIRLGWSRLRYLGRAMTHHPVAALGFLVLASMATTGCHDRRGQSRGGRATAVPMPLPPVISARKEVGLRYGPSTGARRSGAHRLVGRPAPELRIARWTSGDRAPASLAALRGQVVVLYAFQGW